MPFCVPTHRKGIAISTYPVLETWTAVTSAGTAVTSLELTKPSGVVPGDLLIILVGNDYYLNVAWPLHSGWDQLKWGASSNRDCGLVIHSRIADGIEPVTEVVNTNGNADTYGWYIRISNVNSGAPINNYGPTLYVTASQGTILSIDTTVDNCLAFYFLVFDGGDGSPFSVSGSDWAEVDELTSGTTGAGASGCFGMRQVPIAGATENAIVTCSVLDGIVAAQFAVAPA